MKQLRKEDLSLFRYIKDTVLRDFVEKEEMAPLEILHELSCTGSYVYQVQDNYACAVTTNIDAFATDRGRGWVFFDCPEVDENGDCVYSIDSCVPEFVTVTGTDAHGNICIGTPEQTQRIILYDDNLVTISGVNYLVDYVDGRIIMDTSLVVPVYIDYHWNYVSVVDDWASIEAAEPPVVSISVDNTTKKGFQIGAGKHVIREAQIDIFARNQAERNDITEVIYDGLYLKSAPVYEFPTGDVLDVDGTFYGRKTTSNKLTSLFNRTTLNDIGILHGGMTFHKVVSKTVKTNPLLMTRSRGDAVLSDLNAYRSKISFEIHTYTRK